MRSRKSTSASTPTRRHHDKVIAAKVLIESTRASKSLSSPEKRAASRILAGVPDGELPELSRQQVDALAEKPHVRDALIEALARVGVNPDRLAGVIAEGLDAEKIDPKWGTRDKDHNVRHKFLESSLKIVGVTGMDHNPSPKSLNVFVFRSFLGAKPVDVPITAPQDEIVKRRMRAANVRNRNYA